MKRGDVWIAELGQPLKRRPVVVLTSDKQLPRLTNVTVALVTSNVRSIETQVLLDPDEYGLNVRSAVSCDNIHTVPVELLDERVSSLNVDDLNAVSEAVKVALDLW